MDKYVIIDENNGTMLAEIGIEKEANYIARKQRWTREANQALHFNLEEAEAVINFINDVIDWELAQDLHAEPLKV